MIFCKWLLLFGIVVINTITLKAQQRITENVIVVTLDGLRWQEVFGGADKEIINDRKYTKDSAGTHNSFWVDDALSRRKKLFPFLWNTVAEKGQVLGNRWLNSKVDNANRYWFSYPGYNEIFTGYPDTAVNSNDKFWNPNTNVLEYINNQKKYTGKVAAFTSWDVFPYILNSKRSGLYVNADRDSLKFNNASLQLVNDMQFLTSMPLGLRPDVFTYFAAREYLKVFKPNVLYIGFDETDDFAHEGEYDQYLKSAKAQDAMIADLWNYMQNDAKYKNKTTLIITCDHGRGDKIKDQWRTHGSEILDAGQIWIAVMGPDTAPLGEIKNSETLYQKQLAATIAKFMGMEFKAEHPVAPAIATLFK